MKCSHCGAETKVNWGSGEAVICKYCYDDGVSVPSEGYSKPPVGTGQVPSDYQTGIGVAKAISLIGWFLCGISVLIVLASIGAARGMGLLSLGPGLGLFTGGLLLVVAGQATRALLDNANYTRQILELMKKNN